MRLLLPVHHASSGHHCGSAAAAPASLAHIGERSHPLHPAALGRRSLLHSALFAAAAFSSPPQRLLAAEPPPLTVVERPGWTLQIPSAYYIQKSRAKVSAYDDTIFVAADYVGGRSASVAVSAVSVARLLQDSGDTMPLEAAGGVGPRELRELGKPALVASLLASRRDNDPTAASVAGFKLAEASRDGNELRFRLDYPAGEASSMTKATPKARSVLGRSLFVPASKEARGSEAFVLTVWASSISDAVCEIVDCESKCGEGSNASARCECPPPVCSPAAADPGDVAVVESLRLT